MGKNRAWNLASYETDSPQDTASTTAVEEVGVAICLNSLLKELSGEPPDLWKTATSENPVHSLIPWTIWTGTH